MNVEELLVSYERPHPPPELHEVGLELAPAMELAEWIRAVFINEGGPLYNPKHSHLQQADIACLWTNVEYVDGFMPVAATAELVRVGGKPWQRMMTADYLCMLFGRIPSHILKFYAPSAVAASDFTFCRRVHHELRHCAQKLDKDKLPAYDNEGKPIWAMRAHEVEVFIDEVELFGLDACHPNVRALVEAAGRPPLITGAQVAAACGVCGVTI
jgi:Putative phage metallopeptidase